ncbi:hypothetical protein [Stenomitos frigidus]|uniref:Uncharacterized protein n=1 Tax=Stenomitos frigidus ULC18 TaxID=2107698 RepID=A0A2T1DW89_9CYAN|nr:hypothetical protein [Stenomitos frigidus]PSB24757.1 hypothetical protein C7B82_25435 [Stenomitos frigidus ULC18]
MPTKFLESLGGKLAEQWAANLLTPAFIFWSGGLAAWIDKFGWNRLQQWFTQLDEPLQIAVLVSSLLLVAATAFAIQRFDLTVLRFFEGYWPTWMNFLRRRLLAQQRQRVNRLNTRWQALAAQRDQEGLTAEEVDEFVAIDWRLRQVPAQPDRMMPTSLGNLLRAAESQPRDKYGLDAIICWPRLWLVLPEAIKQNLQETRAELNTAARVWLWGILFLIWAVWAWWAIPVALLVAWFAYGWMLGAAATYGDLLESAFDLHRLDLYQALHLPPPSSPAEERPLGRQLTEYLWRGSDREKPGFVYPQEGDRHKPN